MPSINLEFFITLLSHTERLVLSHNGGQSFCKCINIPDNAYIPLKFAYLPWTCVIYRQSVQKCFKTPVANRYVDFNKRGFKRGLIVWTIQWLRFFRDWVHCKLLIGMLVQSLQSSIYNAFNDFLTTLQASLSLSVCNFWSL